MKKFLLLLFAVGAFGSANSQAFVNGGFENWFTTPIDYPLNYYFNSNFDNNRRGLPANVIQITDAQLGTYAVQLTTVANATDTSFGYIVNGDPTNGSGGIPYALKPATVTGYYKCNVAVGDTALFLVLFKEAGVTVSFDVYKFYGTQSTYVPFSLTLTIPGAANPDSVIVGAVSSNAFVSTGLPGSMLQLDNISFTGVASQPTLLNGSFENWTTTNILTPDQWTAQGDTTFRTTDKFAGTYACVMTTMDDGGGFAFGSVITNGDLPPSSGPIGGRPYTLMNDTLIGMYKYIPNGMDSATVWINLTNTSVGIGGAYVGLPPVSVYTPFSIPFSAGFAPDTLLIVLASSYNGATSSNIGSQFFVDNLSLKSQPLSTPQLINWNQFGVVKLFPNPAVEYSTVTWTSNSEATTTIGLFDVTGKLISQNSVTGTGNQSAVINVDGLQRGNYTVTLTQNGAKQSRLLMVK